jgi:hypothetical protein
MRSTIYALSLFVICAALGEDSDPNRTKIAYIPCAQNEEPTFSVTLDYNIKDFTKGTQVIYFKPTVTPQGSFSISGYHGIGQGVGKRLGSCRKKDLVDRLGGWSEKQSPKLLRQGEGHHEPKACEGLRQTARNEQP